MEETGASPGIPGIGGRPQGPQEARKDSPLEASEEEGPVNTLGSDFWPPELGKNRFLLLEAAETGAMWGGSSRELLNRPLSC